MIFLCTFLFSEYEQECNYCNCLKIQIKILSVHFSILRFETGIKQDKNNLYFAAMKNLTKYT